MNYETLLTKTQSIVKEASLLMKNAPFEIDEKGTSANLVTTADLNVQHFLHSRLKFLIDGCGFFCEEEDLREEGDFIWIIDPIDGTANFAHGISECCISVALYHKGEVCLGVVYNPYKDEMFSATLGGGAYLNGRRLSVSGRNFEHSLFCTAASLYKREYADVCFDIIRDVYAHCSDFRRLGSCALELCYLAAGICDLYFEIRVCPWDFGAAYLILKEAGGVICGFGANKPPFDRATPIIAANTPENFEKLNGFINRHLKCVPYEE